jgi:hypothetical protein
MRARLIAPVTAALIAGTIGLTAGTAAAAPTAAVAPAASAAAPAPLATVTGAINETIAGVGTFVGSFTPTRFTTSGRNLTVTGVLAGAFTPVGGEATAVNQVVSTTVTGAAARAACTILDLELGPLDLNVLGLRIQLNEVNLLITAVPGAGNLLGNLLCAIANLLNGGNTGGLATLLNRILGLLGGV